jgi:hypothetical protein
VLFTVIARAERSTGDIRALGGLKRLLALTSRMNDETRKCALQALQPCVEKGTFSVMFTCCPVHTWHSLSSRQYKRADRCCCYCFIVLCADDQARVEIAKSGGIRPLVSMLSSRSEAVQAAAAAVLGLCSLSGALFVFALKHACILSIQCDCLRF